MQPESTTVGFLMNAFVRVGSAGLLALATLVGACDEEKQAEKAEKAQQATEKTKKGPDAGSPDKISEALKPQPVVAQPSPPPRPDIELVSAGRPPKKLLRYSFEEGREKKFVMSMEVVPTMSVDGNPVPGSPPMKFDIEGTSATVKVKEDGTAVRDTVFDKFVPKMTGVPPQLMQQLTAQMAMFSGMAMTETINPQGEVLAVELKKGSVKSPQAQMLLRNLQDGLSNAFLPLPDEKVGAGAQWKGTTTVQTGGLPIKQVSTFELERLQGDDATILVTFDQSAKPQELNDPRIPPGAKAEMVKMDGKGEGKLKVNLKTLNTESTVDMSMKVETEISGLPQGAVPPTPTGAPARGPQVKDGDKDDKGKKKKVLSTTSTTMRMDMKLMDLSQ